jgi:hypothetical protein
MRFTLVLLLVLPTVGLLVGCGKPPSTETGLKKIDPFGGVVKGGQTGKIDPGRMPPAPPPAPKD